MGIWFLFGLTVTVWMGGLSYVLLMLPPEATQGDVQKIFFFHVPSAMALYAFLIFGTIFSIFYLVNRKKIYDQLARSSMYVATLFATLVIISGPIWAKPIWGVYWTWDPRLTTTFVVYVLLLAYVFTRKVFEDREGQSGKGPIVGAILSIFALLDVPLIHFSVQLWRGLHPSVLKNPNGLPPEYTQGLEIMMLATFLLGGLIFTVLYKYIRARERASELLRGAS